MSTTDTRLSDVLAGREDNYLLPFYWQHGGDQHKMIPEQLARIRGSGCRAVCVESRPHPEFVGPGWWHDMDLILDTCKRLGMRVWIFDDKHYPTGYASGEVERHPELRPWMLVERHLDVIGPMPGAAILVPAPIREDEETLLGAYAFRRRRDRDEGDFDTDLGQYLEGEPVQLVPDAAGKVLTWDIPPGCWRIFFLYQSRRGGPATRIDVIDPRSCSALIRAVYEPHYERYQKYFGNVIAGFFSDEPQFGNQLIGPQHRVDPGFYERRIGQEGLALPYNAEVLRRMSEEMGTDAAPYLGELWYESPHSHITRLAYMNAVTRLYRECLVQPIAAWCRERGVEYIGHVIEDMNIHARMGAGPGHFFRALDAQDMSGIDIVLHQVMPGLADYMTAAICAGGAVSPDFFHYSLGKLGASLAHITPHMKGRAMCEVFGAFGWGEGATFMRWLIDFLLVRGINHFIPHAFSPDYPDPDCPPHFGAHGRDPQFDGFSAIMRYTNQAAHLLTGGRHVASAAILYHAEAEWMSAYGKAMLMQKPARALYDRHVDFDIVPADTLLTAARVRDGRLEIAGESFGALVIPAAEYLPAPLLAQLAEFQQAGLAVLFADGVPHGVSETPVPLAKLADAVRAAAGTDLTVDGDYPLLRVFHLVRDGHDIFMLFNESPDKPVRTTLRTSARGTFARLRLLEDFAVRDTSPDGAVAIDLLPGQSEILIFGDTAALPAATTYTHAGTLHPTYAVEIAESDDLTAFQPYTTTEKLFNLNAPGHLPDFSGKIRYRFSIEVAAADAGKPAALDLGAVGEWARLWVNGADAGIRVSAPYRFEVGRHLRAGRNDLLVETGNTLAQKIRDRFSHYLQLRPAGLLGPVTLWR